MKIAYVIVAIALPLLGLEANIRGARSSGTRADLGGDQNRFSCACPASAPQTSSSGCATTLLPSGFNGDEGYCDADPCAGPPFPCVWDSADPAGVPIIHVCPNAAGAVVVDRDCDNEDQTDCSQVTLVQAGNAVNSATPLMVPCGRNVERAVKFYSSSGALIGSTSLKLICVACQPN
jgi:hypothetical protein